MASGSWEFSTSNTYITGRIRWSSTSNGSSANTSTVIAYLDYKKSSSSTASTYGTFTGTITVNGSSGSISKSLTLACNNTWVNVGSRTVTVTHNSDGTKSITIAAGGGISGTSFSSSSTSKSVTLDTIPRYAAISTFKNTAKTQTSATFSWTANAACDRIRYKVGNGSYVDVSSTTAAGGTFTVSGLAPGTSYDIRLEVKRQDSQLITESAGTINVATTPIASLSGPFNFMIGNDLSLTINNSANNASALYLYVQNDSSDYEKIDAATVTVAADTATYTWDLSSIEATLYSKCTAKKSMAIKIYCGITLNNIRYENIYDGIAAVTNSDPTFTTYAFGNSDTVTNGVLGNTAYIVQSYGNMQAQISTANKAAAQNGASIVKYIATVANSSEATVLTKEAAYSPGAEVIIDFGNAFAAGTYTMKLYAQDSRGNFSTTISKTFYVLPYHRPQSMINLARQNGYEKEITLDLTAYYSQLFINNTAKNTTFTVKYRYKEVSTATWSSYVTLSDFTNSTYNINDTRVTLTKTADDPLLTLSTANSYNFEFILTDKVTFTTESMLLPQGIPIMIEADNGKVAVGMVPEWTSSADFQVATDILATDSSGKQHMIISELDAKAPKSHASSATTYGVGTTADYGHCMTVNNLTTSAPTDGYALSAYQGKVLNDKIAALPQFISGSVVKVAAGTSVIVFTQAQLNTMFGLSSSSIYNFTAIFNNGDAVVSTHIEGATWSGTNLYAVFDVSRTGNIRINYTIIYNPTLYQTT